MINGKMSVDQAMALAVSEARKGLGYVAPNPAVGCVILDREQKFLASGYHHRVGDDHAEVDALKHIQNPKELAGATVVVTLEPCSHQGRTPSCARKLAALPIAKVVYGLTDPNPLVNGRGLQILQNAGIKAERFSGEPRELNQLTEVFFCNMQKRRALIALKVATTFDGVMAPKSGSERQITGAESLRYAHYLRAIYDGILVGRGTVESDNPRLDVRHPDFADKQNRALIIDPEFKLRGSFDTLRMAQAHVEKNILLFARKSALNNKSSWPAECLQGFDNSQTPAEIVQEVALKAFREFGICSILVEGGAKVYQHFFAAGLVDRLYHFQTTKILGAQAGLIWTDSMGSESLAKAWTLVEVSRMELGEDLLTSARVNFPINSSS